MRWWLGRTRFLTATVSRGKLGFECVVPEVTGPPSYHPLALLKLYIYGYLNRVQSSRRLERGRSQSRGDLASRLIGPG